ncbi:MAG: hypothetical protein MJA32_12325 [Proteobacteria bacterium]|nr:hypothetical protein [Pseudomonadota bacterium]
MKNEWERDTAHRAKALFDESVEALDGATLSALNRSRHRALEELARPRPRWMRWAPAAGMAAAVALAVLLTLPGPARIDVLPATVADVEILLGDESFEMLEDLEFYALIDALESGSDVG